jgi:hypothetical protein
MRRPLQTFAVLAAGALAGSPALAQPSGLGVRVEHAAARMVVISEPRGDVSVTVAHGASRLPPLQVRREGGVIVVDGGLERPFGSDRVRCVGGWTSHPAGHWLGVPVTHTRDDRAVVVEGVGRVDYGELPLITVHLPRDARIADDGAVWGQIGATDSLHLATVGCGDWSVGPVRGGFDAQMVGSGDVAVASTGPVHAQLSGSGDLSVGPVGGGADLTLAGTGDVRTGRVAGPLKLALAGSGDIEVAEVRAPVQAHIASSGDVRIHRGYAPQVNVQLAGSGDFVFDGAAGRLAASVVGSGEVHVGHVDGPVSKSVMGSGEVTVGN